MPKKLDPAALSAEDVARLFSAAGGDPVTAEMIEADLSAGAPQNPDRTINLLNYAAWLARARRGE